MTTEASILVKPLITGYIELYCLPNDTEVILEQIENLCLDSITGMYVLEGKIYPSMICLISGDITNLFDIKTKLRGIKGVINVKSARVKTQK